jgi:hypothetical protein
LLPQAHGWHAIDQSHGSERGEFSVPRGRGNKILMVNGKRKAAILAVKGDFSLSE